MNKPTVGQTVYSLNVGNAARHKKQVLTKCVVVKVGRKYFTARYAHDESGWSETQYRIDTWAENTNFPPNSVLYADEQEYFDEKEADTLCRAIEPYFKYGRNPKRLPLSSLRKIAEICKL